MDLLNFTSGNGKWGLVPFSSTQNPRCFYGWRHCKDETSQTYLAMSSVTFMRPSRIKWAPWGCIIVALNPVYPLVKVFDDFAGELPVQHGQLACHKVKNGAPPASPCSPPKLWPKPTRKRAWHLLIHFPIIVARYFGWSHNTKEMPIHRTFMPLVTFRLFMPLQLWYYPCVLRWETNFFHVSMEPIILIGRDSQFLLDNQYFQRRHS